MWDLLVCVCVCVREREKESFIRKREMCKSESVRMSCVRDRERDRV